jgi:hypothetical protein
MARRTKAEVRIVAKDEASKEVKKAETSFQKFSKLLSVGFAAAGLAAVAAIKSLGDAFQRSIDLSATQEQALEGLRSQLSDLGPATDRVTESLAAFAAERQKVTTFGDEVTIQAQQQLAVFAKSEDALKALTVATQDFAIAQGIDLNSAAKLLGKTLGSSTNALTRYGVEVEGAVGSTERLESLTGNLATLFGGRATDATNTYAGALEQLENAQGDTAETIGEIATKNEALIDIIKERTVLEGQLSKELDGQLTIGGKALALWNAFLGTFTQLQIAYIKLAKGIKGTNTELEQFNKTGGAAVEQVTSLTGLLNNLIDQFGETGEAAQTEEQALDAFTEAFKRQADAIEKEIFLSKRAADEQAAIDERRGISTETTKEATEAQDEYNLSLGNQEPAAAFVRGQEAIQASLRGTQQAIAVTSAAFDQLAAAQGRSAAVAAGLAGGGRLVQGGRSIELAGGGSRLTSTPGLSGGLSERRTGSYSNL